MGTVEKRGRTLRKQIILSFHTILGLSIVATVLTWGAALLLLMQMISSMLNPANYYEQLIPALAETMEEHADQLLQPSGREWAESVIPLEGIQYEVVNARGQALYGTFRQAYITNQEELYQKLNTQLFDDNRIIKYYPLLNGQGELQGAIGLSYTISLYHANPSKRGWIMIGFMIVLASPFAYFYLFSLLIGRRFSRRIEKPFHQLMEGARKIQQQDLDFQLPAIQHSKELDRLVQAFEEMRAALKQSLSRQWELEDERREMVASIAHDLRTPLTIIHGHVEGLMEGGAKQSERLERYLQTIYESTKRSIRLLDQMSGATAVEQAEFILQLVPVQIKAFIQDKAEEYALLCARKQLEFHCSIDAAEDGVQDGGVSADSALKDNTDAIVHMDADRMSQVLDNIVTNSLRYTPEGGKMVWQTRIGSKQVQFKILDSGPGIQAANPEIIFEKFYREDRSRTGEGGHAGLGLYIASVLVQKHGGTIAVENRAEGGASFMVTIPR